MKQKIINFCNILELILPDKISCLFFGIYIGINSIIIPEYWYEYPKCTMILMLFMLLTIMLLVLNYFEFKAIHKEKIS